MTLDYGNYGIMGNAIFFFYHQLYDKQATQAPGADPSP